MEPIATFVDFGTGQRRETPVLRIAAAVGGKGGAWTASWVALMAAPIFSPDCPCGTSSCGHFLPTDRYYRERLTETYRTRALALRALRSALWDHFGGVPAGTVLRPRDRADEVPFPATA